MGLILQFYLEVSNSNCETLGDGETDIFSASLRPF